MALMIASGCMGGDVCLAVCPVDCILTDSGHAESKVQFTETASA